MPRRRAKPTKTPPSSTDDDVPSRVLAAAATLFAEKGYGGTSIRDVVAQARTNLNAINYHFRSKQKLYEAVMRDQAALAERAHPRNRGHARTNDPKAVLAETVDDFLTRLLDPKLLLPRLYALEMLHPGSAFSLADVGKGEHQALRSAVTDLLGPAAKPARVARCTRSVYSQCAYLMFVRHLLPMIDPSFRYSPRAIKALADHITKFSLAGIAAIRNA